VVPTGGISHVMFVVRVCLKGQMWGGGVVLGKTVWLGIRIHFLGCFLLGPFLSRERGAGWGWGVGILRVAVCFGVSGGWFSCVRVLGEDRPLCVGGGGLWGVGLGSVGLGGLGEGGGVFFLGGFFLWGFVGWWFKKWGSWGGGFVRLTDRRRYGGGEPGVFFLGGEWKNRGDGLGVGGLVVWVCFGG